MRIFTAIGLLLALIVSMSSSGMVSAHTDFDGSTPSDGATVDAPVSEVTVVFTAFAEPAGEGFVALDPAGVVRTPSVTTTDDETFLLTFDPPLAGGPVGVKWNIRSRDGHNMSGSFSFNVTAPAPDVVVPADPDPTAPETGTSSAPASPAPETSEPATSADVAASPVEESPSSSPPSVASPTGDAEAGTAGSGAAPTGVGLDEFLEVEVSSPGETASWLGRLVSFLAVVVMLGGLVFAVRVMRGSTEEITRLVSGIRIAGVVLVVGSLVEYSGVVRRFDESWASAWSTSAGAATLMRTVGGLAVTLGLGAASRATRTGRTLSSAAASPSAPSPAARALSVDADRSLVEPHEAERWTPHRKAWIAFAGAALTVISFWFDGHTVTKGIRPLHALSNSVHVVAGSIWVGGAIWLTVVLWARHRVGRSGDGAGLVLRFSTIATVALAAVFVGGVAMVFSILDSFGEITSTQWGNTMLAKLAAVGVAVVLGAYNHFRLRPALERSPDNPDLLRSVRVALTAEAAVLVIVVAITSRLVASAF